MSHSNHPLYPKMKGLVYHRLEAITAKTTPDCIAAGHKDIWDWVMKDTDSIAFAMLIREIPGILSEKQSQILLDGLAEEYAGVENWVAFVDQECQD